MVLQFDSPSNCLVVRQYLDRCRKTMRRELSERFRAFMTPSTAKKSEGQVTELADAQPAKQLESENLVREEDSVKTEEQTGGEPCKATRFLLPRPNITPAK